MHYENGHEVAQQLAREVHQIAFSPTKAWIRREGPEETYMCQLGSMIALKLHAMFDCSPDNLLSIILKKQTEWDMNLRHEEILEEYDHFNKIKLQKYLLPIAGKMVYMCLYVCVIASQPNTYSVVYQSIDHERIPPYEPLVTVFPSGFFLSPVPGEPRKCHLTSVFQFQVEQNPKVVTHLCTSSERIISGLKGTVSKGEPESWDFIVNLIRRDLYNTVYALEPSNGWSLRFQRAGMKTYTKHNQQEFRVATRTAFNLPYKCHDVAAQLFKASQNGKEWDQFVDHVDPPTFLGPNTFITGMSWVDLQDGTESRGYMLTNLNYIKDNVCDVTYKIAYDEPPVTFMGWLHSFMCCGSFVVYPCHDNPEHATVQNLIDTPHSKVCSDEGIKRESLRVHHYLNALIIYITKNLHQDSLHAPSENTKITHVDLPRHDVPYAAVMDSFSKMLMHSPSIFDGPPESPRASRLEPFYRTSQSKRKHLMNVDDVVFSNPNNIVAPLKITKPFLFLVSDDGSAHRFLRRRLESPISHSKFDSLPQEIILEIFKFLGPSGLNSIACSCTHFKDLVINCQLWRSLYCSVWGDVRGRVARRYCGDDDPATFFASFPDWRELYMEKQYIEAAWEAPERRALSFTVTKAHSRSIQSMALLSSKHRLVTGSQDRLVRVWDVTSGACLLNLHSNSSCVAVTPWSDTHVKVGYKEGIVQIFDVAREESTSELRVDDVMHGCIFSNTSIISWHDQNATHWDETTGQRISTFSGHLQRIKRAALCPAQSILYTASRDTTVRLWDLHNRTKIGSIQGHTKAVNAVTLVGNMCVTGSSDKSVKVWDVRKLGAPLHILSEHSGKLTCIYYTEIGNKLCTGGEDGVNIWNASTFKHIRKDFDGEYVTSIALDEESLAYGGLNGQIQYYDFTPHR